MADAGVRGRQIAPLVLSAQDGAYLERQVRRHRVARSLSEGEIRFGIEQLEDAGRRADIHLWFDRMLRQRPPTASSLLPRMLFPLESQSGRRTTARPHVWTSRSVYCGDCCPGRFDRCHQRYRRIRCRWGAGGVRSVHPAAMTTATIRQRRWQT